MHAVPSFRDPEGVCWQYHKRILRFIYPSAADRVKAFSESDFALRLQAEGLLVRTRLLAEDEAASLHANAEQVTDLFAAHDGLIFEHERIAFQTYPHEWCPEMLFVAGELTLDLQLRAMDVGLTLKDATPTNILFRGSQPIFADFLSFVPRRPGAVLWPAYAQFVRNFLLPLLLYRYKGEPTNNLFLAYRDGMEPEEAYRYLSGISRFRPLALSFASLPTWLGRTKSAETVQYSALDLPNDAERADYIARQLIFKLQSAFRKLQPVDRSSVWSKYMNRHSYESTAFVAKEVFVRAALKELAPRTVLDVGCNNGHFSHLAATLGAEVVALDFDSAVISQLWVRSRNEKLPILPLVINLARPSPGLGWCNTEQISFLNRARGHFDAALLLAVIHHLTVTDGIPLPELFRVIAKLVTGGIIVEYVPPEDPMFCQMSRNKKHLIPHLGRPQFEAAYAQWFDLVRHSPLPSSLRWIYFLRRKE
jgi:SAM-dependent methyltransferase